MITVSTDASRSRAFDVSSRNSDSGVVIRMSDAFAAEARALDGRRIARPDGNLRHGDRDAARPRDVGDAGERRAKVPLDVDGQRLERRHVEHAAPLRGRRRRLEHQAVEAPEKRGERLAAAGRREDERRFAAGDRGPAKLLRPSRRVEGAAEPFADRRIKEVEGLDACHDHDLSTFVFDVHGWPYNVDRFLRH